MDLVVEMSIVILLKQGLAQCPVVHRVSGLESTSDFHLLDTVKNGSGH